MKNKLHKWIITTCLIIITFILSIFTIDYIKAKTVAANAAKILEQEIKKQEQETAFRKSFKIQNTYSEWTNKKLIESLSLSGISTYIYDYKCNLEKVETICSELVIDWKEFNNLKYKILTSVRGQTIYTASKITNWPGKGFYLSEEEYIKLNAELEYFIYHSNSPDNSRHRKVAAEIESLLKTFLYNSIEENRSYYMDALYNDGWLNTNELYIEN